MTLGRLTGVSGTDTLRSGYAPSLRGMDLLNNAVESIQVGIEDYNVGTPARLRSCVRSIHAGILLLFKERLRQLSPPETNELLIKAKFKPVRRGDGTVLLIGDGRRTVDVQQIKERFGIARHKGRLVACGPYHSDPQRHRALLRGHQPGIVAYAHR